MTNNPQQRTAQQVRDDHRAERQKRFANRQNPLPEPVFPAGAIVDLTDGTLNKDVLQADMVIEMPRWPNTPPPGTTAQCDLMWAPPAAGGGPPPDGDFRLVHNVVVNDASTYPIKLTLPKAEMAADGPYYLAVRITDYNGSVEWTTRIPLICDGEPPYGHNVPTALAAPPEPITDKYLTDHSDEVILTLPQYPDFMPEDKVTYYWGTLPLPDDPNDIPPAGSVKVDNTVWPMPLKVSAAHIIGAGDGGCYALYLLHDKATNMSRVSAYTPLVVALGTLPDNMQIPLVPLADGGLDSADAAEGVEVHIPAFNNHKANDKIVVTWGTTALEPDPIGSVPTFPLVIQVPAKVMQDTYGAATGEVDTAVSYVVRRGGLDSASSAITIKVNFWTPGPPNPDWPDPANPTLVKATVMGKNSQIVNQLTRADTDEDATMTFTVYKGPVAGDVIKFYWAGTEVKEAEYALSATDLEGAEIERPLPWNYIRDAYNDPQLPMIFKITNPASGNSQQSKPTLVDADAVVLSPPAPTFEALYQNTMLNCASLYEVPGVVGDLEPAIRVRVGDLSQAPYSLKAGDKVTMSWAAYTPAGVLIPGTEQTEDVTIDADHAATGFIWKVQPYAEKILPTYSPGVHIYGLGRISYSLLVAGDKVTSGVEEKMVAMSTPQSSCQLLPNP